MLSPLIDTFQLISFRSSPSAGYVPGAVNRLHEAPQTSHLQPTVSSTYALTEVSSAPLRRWRKGLSAARVSHLRRAFADGTRAFPDRTRDRECIAEPCGRPRVSICVTYPVILVHIPSIR